MIIKKKIPIATPNRVPICDVRDVAKAHYLAINNEATYGQRIAVCTRTVWFKDIFTVIRENFPAYGITSMEMSVWMLKVMSLFVPAMKGNVRMAKR